MHQQFDKDMDRFFSVAKFTAFAGCISQVLVVALVIAFLVWALSAVGIVGAQDVPYDPLPSDPTATPDFPNPTTEDGLTVNRIRPCTQTEVTLVEVSWATFMRSVWLPATSGVFSLERSLYGLTQGLWIWTNEVAPVLPQCAGLFYITLELTRNVSQAQVFMMNRLYPELAVPGQNSGSATLPDYSA